MIWGYPYFRNPPNWEIFGDVDRCLRLLAAWGFCSSNMWSSHTWVSWWRQNRQLERPQIVSVDKHVLTLFPRQAGKLFSSFSHSEVHGRFESRHQFFFNQLLCSTRSCVITMTCHLDVGSIFFFCDLHPFCSDFLRILVGFHPGLHPQISDIIVQKTADYITTSSWTHHIWNYRRVSADVRCIGEAVSGGDGIW